MPAEHEKTCFIAMPITTHPDQVETYGGDTDHWRHVMDSIHVPAVRAAGFVPITPISRGTQMIMGDIIKHLSHADMVLCDLSGHNPNVFFELGVRTSLNLPIALVKDEHLQLPFDTSGLNTHQYDSTLHAWNSAKQISEVEHHIRASASGSDGQNPMWRHFGLNIAADAPSSESSSSDARLELLLESVNDMRTEMNSMRRRVESESLETPTLRKPTQAVQHLFTLAPALNAEVGGTLTKVAPLGDREYRLRFESIADLSKAPSSSGAIAAVLERSGYVLRDLQIGFEMVELTVQSAGFSPL